MTSNFAKNEKELKNLMQAVSLYSTVIGMEFCYEKCAMLSMKNEKRQMTEGMIKAENIVVTLID